MNLRSGHLTYLAARPCSVAWNHVSGEPLLVSTGPCKTLAVERPPETRVTSNPWLMSRRTVINDHYVELADGVVSVYPLRAGASPTRVCTLRPHEMVYALHDRWIITGHDDDLCIRAANGRMPMYCLVGRRSNHVLAAHVRKDGLACVTVTARSRHWTRVVASRLAPDNVEKAWSTRIAGVHNDFRYGRGAVVCGSTYTVVLVSCSQIHVLDTRSGVRCALLLTHGPSNMILSMTANAAGTVLYTRTYDDRLCAVQSRSGTRLFQKRLRTTCYARLSVDQDDGRVVVYGGGTAEIAACPLRTRVLALLVAGRRAGLARLPPEMAHLVWEQAALLA